MSVTAKVIGGHYDQNLRVTYDGAMVVHYHIDRTYYGPEWCQKHGMVITDTIEADNGEKFDIWRRGNESVCAIPNK